MARHPRAERGVVGADIGVVGRDIEAPDQDEVDAVADRGERQQSEHADHDEFALARFRRGGSGGCGGGAAGLRLRVAGASRRGGAWLLPRRGSATGPRAARWPRRSFVLRRFRLRRERCVRPGLSLRPSTASPFKCRDARAAENRPHAAPSSSKVSLTERFGQAILLPLRTITRKALPAVSRVEFFREKINQWLHPHQTRFISSATRTVRSAGRFWTARARCSWIWALTAPA